MEGADEPGVMPRRCLQVSRSGIDAGASSIWLASEAEAEFTEWKEMLSIAANKRRSQVSTKNKHSRRPLLAKFAWVDCNNFEAEHLKRTLLKTLFSKKYYWE